MKEQLRSNVSATPAPLDQREQVVKDFWLKLDDLAVAHQLALGGAQPVGTEFVNLLWLMADERSNVVSNSAPRNFLENP